MILWGLYRGRLALAETFKRTAQFLIILLVVWCLCRAIDRAIAVWFLTRHP